MFYELYRFFIHNMSMTYEQFIKYAVDLKKHSDSIDDDWNFCEYQNPMVKICT